MSRFNVKKVAVLGAGVMGAQIAAHLVNVKVPVILFDLPDNLQAPTLPAERGSLPPEGAGSTLGRPGGGAGSKSGIAERAIANLKKLKPSPIGVADDVELIQPANYEEHMKLLKGCDLVIEAIAERMDWKLDLYHKIAPFVAKHALLASNTSGLSITKLSEALPDAIKPRFCGIHFFNPPRYMQLVELINTPTTQPEVLDQLEAFVTTTLGKGVVRAHDTPNFIANRIGIAGMLSTMKQAENFGLSFDVVDDLTGKKLGRASSGTFRTADVVGLDTMAHVIKTMQENLNEQSDPFYGNFGTPKVLQKLLDLGFLGQKTKQGFYKRVGRETMQFELDSEDYIPAGGKADAVYGRMLKKPAAERLKLLRNAEGKEGQFLWAILRDSFHYAAVHLEHIADCARDVDRPVRWVRHAAALECGSRWAGWKWPRWFRKTVMPARRCARRRCPNGWLKALWPKPVVCTRPMARGAHHKTSLCRAVCCPCTSVSCSPRNCWAKPIFPTGRPLARQLQNPRRCVPGRSMARS